MNRPERRFRRRGNHKPKVESFKVTAMRRARAILGEAFDDYAILARSRSPDCVERIVSDVNWAKGALDDFLSDIYS